MDPIKVYFIGVISFLLEWIIATWRLKGVFQNYEQQIENLQAKPKKGTIYGESKHSTAH